MRDIARAFVLLPVLLAGLASAQPKKLTDVPVQGYVYKPMELEPTDARVAQLKLPAGFRIQKFATGLQNPRILAIADDGTVYVTRRENGDCLMLKDSNGDGKADAQQVVAQKKGLHGIAIRGAQVYLATVKEVYVADRKPDGTLGALRAIVTDLPDGGQHPNRTLGFGPDGLLYVTVGSTCNACRETSQESAAVVRMRPDGTGREVFASGLRNTIGFGWHPETKRLYGWDQGIDWLGNDAQREEINLLEQGGKYGWPYLHENNQSNPQDDPPPGQTKEQLARESKTPALLHTAHSAGMQWAFYTGAQFPAEYRNDAFVTLRGSWNRKPPSGYEVVRVRFENGMPVRIEPFISGFLVPQPDGTHANLGRLCGLAQARDGSLLVSDDTQGVIYRVSYEGGAARSSATR